MARTNWRKGHKRMSNKYEVIKNNDLSCDNCQYKRTCNQPYKFNVFQNKCPYLAHNKVLNEFLR